MVRDKSMWMSLRERRMKGLSRLPFLSVVIFSSCSRYQQVSRVPESEMVGTWMASDRGAFLDGFCCKDKPVSLTLSRDGTFQLMNIPDCWLVDSRGCKAILNSKGAWMPPH